METRTAKVIIDYQNVHLTGHDTFAPNGVPKHESLVHPLLFAAQVIEVRNLVLATQAMRGLGPALKYELVSVDVFRGLPSNRDNPDGYRRNQAQKAEWTRDRRVSVTLRSLKPTWVNGVLVPREKGVDVMVAIDLIRSADRHEADVLILASHDTDMEPALAAALEVSDVAIETAGWRGCRVLRVPGERVHHTALDGARFVRSRDRRDYT